MSFCVNFFKPLFAFGERTNRLKEGLNAKIFREDGILNESGVCRIDLGGKTQQIGFLSVHNQF